MPPKRRTHKVSLYVAPAVIFFAVLLLWGPALFGILRLHFAQYSDDRYAFYTDSGNVFYGTVRGVSFTQVTLSDAFSFQTVSVGETTTSNLQSAQGNPLTRPDNWLVMNWDHIIFYERIGDEASVLKAIDQMQ